MERDHGSAADEAVAPIRGKIALRPAARGIGDGICALENLDRIAAAFRFSPGLDARDVITGEPLTAEAIAACREPPRRRADVPRAGASRRKVRLPDFLLQWLSFYGPAPEGLPDGGSRPRANALDDPWPALPNRRRSSSIS